MKHLINILETSVKLNGGDKPLTISHLLNICKLAQKLEHKGQEQEVQQHESLINAIGPYGEIK